MDTFIYPANSEREERQGNSESAEAPPVLQSAVPHVSLPPTAPSAQPTLLTPTAVSTISEIN